LFCFIFSYLRSFAPAQERFFVSVGRATPELFEFAWK
jgi:hypothetical protein